MKNMSLVILMTLFALGCGSKKNPVGSDLKTLREQGKEAQKLGPVAPAEKIVVVEKDREVRYEQSTIDSKFLLIETDSQMDFEEGKTSSFKVMARSLIKNAKIVLSATGLPDGATFTPSNEADTFNLSWTPDLYTIPSNSNRKNYSIKFSARVDMEKSSAANPADLEKLKGLLHEKTISLTLFKNNEVPSDLKISGLPTEILEGSTPTAFSVIVKVPGINDKAPQKPRLIISYDGVSVTAGNNFLEMDGSRHVVRDLTKKDAEYLGNFQWKFSLIFDTKNIPVQPQLAKDGSFLVGADGTRVRLSFKVDNNQGLSTPETLYQVKIKYNKQAGQ